MLRCLFKTILIILVSALLWPSFIFAEDLESKCLRLTEQEECQTTDATQCRKELEQCEEYYQQEIERIGADLSKTEQEKKTLQNEIYTLTRKIKNLNYQIYQSNLVIKDLGFQIEDTIESIDVSTFKIYDSKEKLANILRAIYEKDQKPLVEILLSEADLSDFFDDLVALEILNSKTKELLQNIKILKTNLEDQKESLGEEKGNLKEVVKIQELQREESAKTKSEREYYWDLTEEEYQRQLKEQEDVQKKAAEIRTRLFELIGVAEGGIEFGKAVEIAKYVEKITKVRPAFLLAIIAQESMRYGKFGGNVGQCYLKNPTTGAGVGVRTGRVINKIMKPSRDVGPFLEITKELGRDPYSTPVSCPMSYGWGGAMGPAQFIPSTWMIYKDGVKKITGKPGDPWDIRDAFLASGLYLSASRASSQTRNSEWKAAMIYFSGSTTNPAYYWYANQVLNKADGFNRDIKALEAVQ